MEQHPLRPANRDNEDGTRSSRDSAPTAPSGNRQISIVLVPSLIEFHPIEVLGSLLDWLSSAGLDHELIITIDGGHQDLLRRFEERVAGMDRVRIVALNSRQGQLAAIRAGIAVSSGRYVVTFPAYPQVECAAIPSVLARLEAGADYVIGYRVARTDSVFNRIATRLYNHFVHGVTGVRFRDISCGLHGLRRDIAAAIPTYGDTLIFLPILATREGFKLEEVPVKHDPAEPKLRVFSPVAYLRRVLSLMSLAFLVRFTEKPLRPFGAIGGLLFLAGLVLGSVLVWQRLFAGRPLAERPMLLLALLLITAGIQVIIVGLIGELLVYLHFRDQVRYRIVERIGSTRKEDRT